MNALYLAAEETAEHGDMALLLFTLGYGKGRPHS
jgi:hypothetical protein